jgi:uncharacterized membrane protein YhhN
MIKNYYIFIIIFIVFFLLREYFSFKQNITFKYILTPLLTFTTVAAAIFSLHFAGVTSFRLIIIIALIFALIGDVLLMIEETDLFIHGLLFFLFTQLLYIAALVSDYNFNLWTVIPAIILITSILYLYFKINMKTRKHDIPLLFYMFAIGSMLYFAISRLNAGFSANALLFSTGALLFVVSDVLLAVDRFIVKLPKKTVIVWFFYAPAQFLIGLSCYYS